MTVYRDRSSNCWIVTCRFRDANGIAKRTTKRGFTTQRETEEWELMAKSEEKLRSGDDAV